MTVTKVDQIEDILKFLEVDQSELPGFMNGIPDRRLKMLDEFMKQVVGKLKSEDNIEELKRGLRESKERIVAQN